MSCLERSSAIRRAPAWAVAALTLVALGCSSSAANTKLAIGESCGGDNASCASDLCQQIDSSTSLCTQACTKDSNCPSQYLCTPVSGGGNVCLPIGLDGVCQNSDQCTAGFQCDTTADRCYIPVTNRQLCDPCTSDVQCSQVNGVGGICRVDGSIETCTQECADTPCPDSSYVCKVVIGSSQPQCVKNNAANTCSPELGLCAACASDFECGPGNSCVQNLATSERLCATACQSATDCPTDFNCTDLSGVGTGPNVCTPNSGTCAGYCDGTDADTVLRECGYGLTCNLTTNQCVQKTDGSLCAACTSDNNCSAMGNSCLENSSQSQLFCSSPCNVAAGAAACPLGFTCGQLGSGAGIPDFCLPNSGSCLTGQGAVGDDCSGGGPAQCASGICLGLGVQSICSVSCTVNSDCGNDTYQCCALGADGTTYDCAQSPGVSGGVCAPVGGVPGADCSPGSPPCQNGVCLDLGTADVCSVLCTTASDCQGQGLPGFLCENGEQQNGDGSTTSVQVCFPPGGGALGVNCDFGPAACASGLCLKAEVGSTCTQSCSDSTPCPTGYGCKSEALVSGATATTEVCVASHP